MNGIKNTYRRSMTYYQNLSDDARMQFIVRALFNNKKRASKDKIIKLYKEGLNVKSVDEERLLFLIDCLAEDGRILSDADMYYLPDTTESCNQKVLVFLS